MSARRIVGIVMLLVGGVWFFQGIGVIGGSFMTDSPTWVLIGGVVVIVGAVLVFSGASNRKDRSDGS